jgi:hypothetical protein
MQMLYEDQVVEAVCKPLPLAQDQQDEMKRVARDSSRRKKKWSR